MKSRRSSGQHTRYSIYITMSSLYLKDECPVNALRAHPLITVKFIFQVIFQVYTVHTCNTFIVYSFNCLHVSYWSK